MQDVSIFIHGFTTHAMTRLVSRAPSFFWVYNRKLNAKKLRNRTVGVFRREGRYAGFFGGAEFWYAHGLVLVLKHGMVVTAYQNKSYMDCCERLARKWNREVTA